jgi:hypothetical protein
LGLLMLSGFSLLFQPRGFSGFEGVGVGYGFF